MRRVGGGAASPQWFPLQETPGSEAGPLSSRIGGALCRRVSEALLSPECALHRRRRKLLLGIALLASVACE